MRRMLDRTGAALALALATLAGCGHHHTTSTGTPPSGVMTATVDGAAWNPASARNGTAFRYPVLGVTMFFIGGVVHPDSTGSIILMTIPSPPTLGQVVLGGPGQAAGAAFVRLAPHDTLIYATDSTVAHMGQVTITRYDPLLGAVSGTFGYVAVDSLGDPVTITNGHFDVPISASPVVPANVTRALARWRPSLERLRR